MSLIPVSNIYHLLCYAWDEFAPGNMRRLEAEEFDDTLHLFARQLIAGAWSLHKRGFEIAYTSSDELSVFPRGRILIGPTIRTLAMQSQRLHCSADEITSNIRSNQILKATIERLVGVQSLSASFRRDLREVSGLFRQVSQIQLSRKVFKQVRIHQNNRLHSFLLTICRFLFECLEPQDHAGEYQFREVDTDERRMRRIFEKFVRNFFARCCHETFSVGSERMRWSAVAAQGSNLNFLPRMHTDVTLRSASRTIILECKYTAKLFQNHHSSNKLRSTHLYQLCAYLQAVSLNGGADKNAEGILLYPVAGSQIDQSYFIHGHRITVRTLDLKQHWSGIEQQMLTLVESPK